MLYLDLINHSILREILNTTKICYKQKVKRRQEKQQQQRMDITRRDQKCSRHPQNKLKFIQVKAIENQQQNNLVYCTLCADEDPQFKSIDYVLIQKVINNGSSQIIQKWPPVNNHQLIDKLIQAASKSKETQSIQQQINTYFTQLKVEINNKLDLCQKRMMNIASELPLENDQIISKYQEISKILELGSIMKEDSQSILQKEQNYKQFLKQMWDQRDKNTKELEKLLDQTISTQQLINFEYPNSLKESILSFIEEINFFNQVEILNNNNTNEPRNNQQKSYQNIASEKLIQLISNKSNYCSNQFLNQLKSSFSKLNPLLSQIKFDNIHEANKSPINFCDLNNDELHMIEKQVNHVSEMKKNQNYLHEIKNSLQIKSVNQILNNKFNFINTTFNEQFEKYMLDTYPYLHRVNFSNIISQDHHLKCFENLSDETVNDLALLAHKMINKNQNNNIQIALLNKFKPIIIQQFLYLKQGDIETIIGKYPIFDLIQQPELIDILPNIDLIKGNFSNGMLELNINRIQNNQIQVITNRQSTWKNCFSNFILEKDKRYIFRFEIQQTNIEPQHFFIGLMQNENINDKQGFLEQLSFVGKIQNKQITKEGGTYGIDKYLKGQNMSMSNDNILELRVCIQDKVLEVLDYPNYNYRICLEDKYKDNLINYKDLKLYIGIYYQNQQIILKNAYIVTKFDD